MRAFASSSDRSVVVSQDAVGIVAKISECIASRGGNIHDVDVFVPEDKSIFYSRRSGILAADHEFNSAICLSCIGSPICFLNSPLSSDEVLRQIHDRLIHQSLTYQIKSNQHSVLLFDFP